MKTLMKNNSHLKLTGLSTHYDVVCFSHLRWDFVYQRPQHLLSRFAYQARVFFVEEPVLGNFEKPYLEERNKLENLKVLVPHLPHGKSKKEHDEMQEELLKVLFTVQQINDYVFWYYTPMAMEFTRSFEPKVTVFDSMDELSAFAFAPAELKQLENELFEKTDLVFTGGRSLYEAKKHRHPEVFLFPSSIDTEHFSKARRFKVEPEDQRYIPQPRFGFFGVIDERFDIELLDKVAQQKPEWQFVMIGPVVKIDPAHLPKHENIHYLGMKNYLELPAYLAGWDAALLLFAHNESTRFISPTKTPEYLAAGKPVVSTTIKDVVDTFYENGLVNFGDTPEEYIAAIENALIQKDDKNRIQKADEFLSQNSWNSTFENMRQLISEKLIFKSKLINVRESTENNLIIQEQVESLNIIPINN
jgi:glycosyltransferase involved in cell wall biosynthesis